MSFASDVKDEISRVELTDELKKARLCGLLQSLASLTISSNGVGLILKSTNANVARRVGLDLKDLYEVRSEFIVSKQKNLDKRNIYRMVIDDKALEILNDLDLWTDKGLQDHPRMSFLNNEEMIKAYLAGLFLANGSVNSPSTSSYHLEIKANSIKHGEFIIRLLEKFNISPKITERRNAQIVYIKAGDKIADFLKMIGAHQAVLHYEDIRIQRDFSNSLSRLNNIDIANEQKIQASADKQIIAISYLKEKDLLNLLSEKEREIAQIRFENPEASLSALSELYYRHTGQQLTKSGIRHRLDKILALAEKFQDKER